MNLIYNEMIDRNVDYLNKNRFLVDDKVGKSIDKRRCIALISDEEFIYTENWYNLQKDLKNILDDFTYIIPSIHNTFIVIDKWTTEERTYNIEKYQKIKEYLEKNIKKYQIIYNRIIPVKSGITLCGKANIDINKIRDDLRNMGYIEEELYYLDIIHITLIRWISEISENKQKEIIDYIIDLEEKEYIIQNVSKLKIMECSYAMYSNEIKNILNINLNE